MHLQKTLETPIKYKKPDEMHIKKHQKPNQQLPFSKSKKTPLRTLKTKAYNPHKKRTAYNPFKIKTHINKTALPLMDSDVYIIGFQKT